MCGRFTLHTEAGRLARQFVVQLDLDLAPRYNIAPSQDVLAIRQGPAGREAVMLHWGLVPFWAREVKTGYRMINARAETVAQKPAFRAAYRRRRCLVPADGFYEWRSGPRGKQPCHITLADGAPFAIAGLWERWEGDGTLESCTLIVTAANALVEPIHDRMPVILDPADYGAWLDPATEPGVLGALLRPYPPQGMCAHPVSTRVNNPRNDDPACLEPVEA